jgi:hypothetical protein
VPTGDSPAGPGPRISESRPAPASRGVPSEYALIRAHGGFPGVAGPVTAEYVRGPSMYEMEGPRSVRSPACRSLGWPVSRLLSAADRATSVGRPPEAPVSRLSPRPGVSPGVPGSPPDRHPCFVVSAFLLRRERPAQGVRESNLKILWSSTGHRPLSPAFPAFPLVIHCFIHTPVHRRQRGASLSAQAAAMNWWPRAFGCTRSGPYISGSAAAGMAQASRHTAP